MRKGKVEERNKGVSMVNECVKKVVICPTNEKIDRLEKKNRSVEGRRKILVPRASL